MIAVGMEFGGHDVSEGESRCTEALVIMAVECSEAVDHRHAHLGLFHRRGSPGRAAEADGEVDAAV